MITGEEMVYADPIIGNSYNPDTTTDQKGETLYQRTLREFMCALIIGKYYPPVNLEACADFAHLLTNAYINQLNKKQNV